MSIRCSSSPPLWIGLLAFAACGGSDSVAGQDASQGSGAEVPTMPAPDLDVPVDVGTSAPDVGGNVETSPHSAWPSGKYISVDEVYARLQVGDLDMLLVNVVDEEYYNLGCIAGSLKIPWDTLGGRLAELDRQRHVVVYCRKGVRSESGYATLVDEGFPFVWVMEGGIERWIAAGYSTVPE